MNHSSCPTVSAVREILYSDPACVEQLSAHFTSVDSFRQYLISQGFDIEHCDHVGMLRLLRDFYQTITDDELLLASGGEKFLVATFVGVLAAGATAAAVAGGVELFGNS